MPAAPTERKLGEKQNKAYHQNERTLRFVMMSLSFLFDLGLPSAVGVARYWGKLTINHHEGAENAGWQTNKETGQDMQRLMTSTPRRASL